ncbi:MAG: T9SS type A sorting domain-containing protein [Bacteroidales bacterium]|nr:T9SS type A sorting domain-containing protein [Bacteroidales bacterium]
MSHKKQQNIRVEWLNTLQIGFIAMVLGCGLTANVNGQYSKNPYELAIEILNPHNGLSRVTDPYYGDCPTDHWKPWGGDWATDFSKQGDSCNAYVYVKARIYTAPGGSTAQAIRARSVEAGYACASGVYSQGGMSQKIAFEAKYNNAWYEIGWVLYAHLSDDDGVPNKYLNGAYFDPTNANLGKTFYRTVPNNYPCWPDCHVHVEFFNYYRYPCYNVCQPSENIASSARIGIVGGTRSGGIFHCSEWGDDCMTINGNIASGTYTDDCIDASGNINANGKVKFAARQEVNLTDGFDVFKGAEFDAYTGGNYKLKTTGDNAITGELKPVKISPFKLDINPNPSNGNSVLTYQLKETSALEIVIYNVNGVVVFEEKIEHKTPGKYQFEIPNLEKTGMYIVKMNSRGNSESIKLVII